MRIHFRHKKAKRKEDKKVKKLQKKLKTAKKIQQLLADDPGLLQALALSGGGSGGGGGGGGGGSKKPKKKSTPSDGDDDLAENSNAKGMRENIKVTVRNDSPPPTRGRRRSRSRTPPRRRRSREERGGGDRKRRRSPSPEGEILFHCCFGHNNALRSTVTCFLEKQNLLMNEGFSMTFTFTGRANRLGMSLLRMSGTTVESTAPQKRVSVKDRYRNLECLTISEGIFMTFIFSHLHAHKHRHT